MNQLSVLAVDDEAPALDELAYLLRRSELVSSVRTAGGAEEALCELSRNDFDAVLLDVRMPRLDGMEIARALRKLPSPPSVVFVTAYEHHALDAFDVGAVDYILKPPTPERVERALERIRRLRSVDPGADAGAGDGLERDNLERLAVEVGDRTRMVSRGEVAWVESCGDYVRLHLKDGASHLFRLPLTALDQNWSEHGFVRIHRSHLVALREVRELRSQGTAAFVCVGDRELPVSRRHLHDLRERLVRTPRREVAKP